MWKEELIPGSWTCEADATPIRSKYGRKKYNLDLYSRVVGYPNWVCGEPGGSWVCEEIPKVSLYDRGKYDRGLYEAV